MPEPADPAHIALRRRRIKIHPPKPPDQIRVRAWLDGNFVVIDVDHPDPFENLMIWADGRLVVQKSNFSTEPPYLGHVWINRLNGCTVKVDRSIFPFDVGPVQITVSIWPQGNINIDNGRYVVKTVVLPGSAPSFVLPTVTSGQTLFASRVPRVLFNCHPRTVQEDSLASTLHDIGVSHIAVNLFNSPGDNPSWTTFNLWESSWNELVKQHLDWCVTNGFRILGIGDDFFRNLNEITWIHTGSFREQAIRHVAAYCRDLGVVDGLEMVDEVGPFPDLNNNGLWDVPPAFDYYPAEWIGWWRDEGGPPFAWPNQGPLNWETSQWSDYSSRYLAVTDWRTCLPRGTASHWQLAVAGEKQVTSVPTSRPLMCLVGCNGAFYTKLADGGEYKPGTDFTQNGPLRAQSIVAQAWMALARGASGLRVYGYDWSLWRDQRRDSPIGSTDLQTGARPGDNRWPGLVAAFKSIETRESSLLGTPYVPTESGPWLFGRRGSLVWGVNRSEREQASPNGSGTVIAPGGEAVKSQVPGGGVIIWSV